MDTSRGRIAKVGGAASAEHDSPLFQLMNVKSGYLSYDTYRQIASLHYVTTSGFFDVPPLKLLLDTLPADHIMYSVDYPFGSNEQGAEFLERIEKENVFEKYGGEEAYRGFLRGNAEKLLKLREKGITSA